MTCAPSVDSDQPGHLPSLIRVFAVCMKKAWALSYPLSTQWRLWSDWADAQADLRLRWMYRSFCYAPNLAEVDRAYWFWVVHPCVHPSVHQELCMLGFWNFYMDSSWKNSWHTFFFLSELSPFLELCLFEKSEWNLMHAIYKEPCMLGFWNFIYFLSPFLELCLFVKNRMKSCQQDILKNIWARGLKLGQLIVDDE